MACSTSKTKDGLVASSGTQTSLHQRNMQHENSPPLPPTRVTSSGTQTSDRMYL